MKLTYLIPLAVAATPVVMCCLLRPHGVMSSPDPNDEPADNSYCYVCHVNYKREPLAAQHRDAGVGCMDCHGFSDDHSADEDALTAPDVMFPAGQVNPFCFRCHQPGGAERQRLAPRRAAAPTGVCTTCHGAHRLEFRTRRWNKTTGELIYDDGMRTSGGGGMGM